MTILSDTEIHRELKMLAGWIKHGDEIKKTFEFNNFVEAMKFVNSTASLSERANHHPDIDIRWTKVFLVLSTHSEGGITHKDVALAKEIDSLLK
jgi:4a-hydroxytetrahydrobiopterin dehydratase